MPFDAMSKAQKEQYCLKRTIELKKRKYVSKFQRQNYLFSENFPAFLLFMSVVSITNISPFSERSLCCSSGSLQWVHS